MDFIENEREKRRSNLEKASKVVERYSEIIKIDNGVSKVVPITGKENEYLEARGKCASESAKYNLTEAMFNHVVPDGDVNRSVEYTNSNLEKTDKFIGPDSEEIGGKHFYVEVLDELIECPEKMSFSEYLSFYNQALSMAIANGKINKDDLNSDLFESRSRSR